MKRRIWFGISLLMMFAALTTSGQQAPAPPAAAPTGRELAATMKGIEDELRSTGKVIWSQSLGHLEFHDSPPRYEAVVDRKAFYEEVTNVLADPTSCSLKVVWHGNRDPSDTLSGTSEHSTNGFFYLDEIPVVEVVPSEDFIHRNFHYYSSYREDVQPPIYSAVVSSWGGFFDFKFRSKESAAQFANTLREAISQCSTGPPLPSQSNASAGPTLAETLKFVSDKLSAQGRVEVKWSDVLGGAGPQLAKPIVGDLTVNYFAVNPMACALSFDSLEGPLPYPHARLSFRHISRMEVLTLKEYLTSHPRTVNVVNGAPLKLQATDVSNSFVLNIISIGTEKQLYFSDETLANRVAKAMVHAAELCGAGSKTEPF